MAANIFQNDIGTAFIATIINEDGDVIDISTATVKQIIFKKPSGTSVTQTASFYTDGTDGQIVYASVDGDLDETGTWKLQGAITMSSGSWHSSIVSFSVSCNLEG